MKKRLTFGLTLLLLGACQRSEPGAESNIPANAQAENAANAAPSNTTNAAEQAAPPATATPVDETSAAAAAKIVERYGTLLEQRRFAEAHKLSGDNQQSEAGFAAAFDQFATIDATVGAPGATEGAAGSIYVDVPLTLSGTLKSDGRFTLSGPVTLRRVNNVPGSTAAQRRWHISASDLKPTT